MSYGSGLGQFLSQIFRNSCLLIVSRGPRLCEMFDGFMGSARLSYEFLVLYEIESTVETDVLKI